MILSRAHSRQQGFSMLEVLIAVLVFSLGMIGLAGLLIYAIKSNHVAYLRTQATFLAHNMADRMGANPIALWNDDYSGDYPVTASSADCSDGCTPDELAAYDMQIWSTQLKTFLPAVHANIACTPPNGYVPPAQQIDFRPPYGGSCTMYIRWNEASSANGPQQQNYFYWKFQP